MSARLLLITAACALLVPDARAVDLGISFNETLAGYFTNGDLPYQDAYDQGKAADRWILFTSHVVMEHMQAFVNDTQHGADQQPYHVEGVKHVKGDNCTHFFYMATTLFIRVRRGHQRAAGTIISTGIAQIDLARVIELVGSFRIIGNGTDADKLDDIFAFAQFLIKDVSADCFNATNWETQFWYIWASDGNHGFLIDLIARPDVLELRLETYAAGAAPTVTKQYLPIDDLTVAGGVVRFGEQFSLTMAMAEGSVQDLKLDAHFVLHDMNDFVPPLLYLAFKGLLPQIESYYGNIVNATVAGVNYVGTPLARTTYTFEVGLPWLQWAMLSALSFTDSDLRIEIVGAKLSNNSYIASAYVYFHGKSYHLNDPLLSSTHILAAGELLDGNRVFEARTTATKAIDLHLKCSAPDKQFALLETEGSTTIHTTVLGNCTATDAISGGVFSTASALLELKTKAWTEST